MDYRIIERAGFSPNVGELVSMLDYTRAVTLADVKGLSDLWFHAVEDETSHRWQIRVLKRMSEKRK